MVHMPFDATLRWTTACLFVCGVVTTQARASAIDPPVAPTRATTNEVAVTSVTGESWLNHLHRSFGETSMGKTGRLGPTDPVSEDNPGLPTSARSSASFATRTVTLHGSDLYRLNCQGCHGEAGLGAPPEIGSVINPVRATSVALVMERMKKVGMDISRAEASQLASQANGALLKRLRTGGQDMPAFPHLSEVEIRSLLAYLKQLSGIPGAAKEQFMVRESPVRVGELIVKSTCHTCHSAEGLNPNPQQLLQGAIPPLSVLTTRASQVELVRKVTSGSPITMGTPPLLCRGRMPVFFYLSKDEAANVYQYLTEYGTSTAAVSVATAPTSRVEQAGSGRSESVLASSLLPGGEAAKSDKGSAMRFVGLLGLFVALLLAGGVVVTVRELRRLSAESESRRWKAQNVRLQVLRRTMVSPIRASASSDMESVSSESGQRKASGLRR